jgi:hypothetical protein
VSIGSRPSCNIVLAEERIVEARHAYFFGGGHVQRDERTSDEMRADEDVSALLALTRCLNPLRATPPPAGGACSISSASRRRIAWPRRSRRRARSSSTTSPTGRPSSGTRACGLDPQDVAEARLASLARRTAEHGYPLTDAGLAALETALAAQFDPSDEGRYWADVLTLGAFGGEVLRAVAGVRWVSQHAAGILPFSFACTIGGEPAQLYLLAKAMKRLEHGEEDSLVAAIHFAQSRASAAT